MNRIESNNVHMGGEFIVPPDEPTKNIAISHASGKEHELFLNAQNQAKQIIEKAQTDAANLLENAKNEAKEEIAQMADNARKGGFSVGKKQGEDAIKKELEDKIIAVNNFAEGCFEVKDAIIKSAHRDMVNLITQIAHKVCSKSLELDDKVLEAITQKAIHSLKDKESINIIVNPDMAEKIYSLSDDLKEKIPQLESIKVIEDKSVSPDGVIVESPMSRVDCRISSQISTLTDKLMSAVNSADIEELMPTEEVCDNTEDATIVETKNEEEAEQLPEIEENSDTEIVEADVLDAKEEQENLNTESEINSTKEEICENPDGFQELHLEQIKEQPDS